MGIWGSHKSYSSIPKVISYLLKGDIFIGIMEDEMDTTVLYRVLLGVILVLYYKPNWEHKV